MANTLTNLIPVIYEAMDTVSREMVGFIPAVSRNSSAERAAVGETITYPIVPAITPVSITPGTTTTDDGDATIGSGSMTISKAFQMPVRWSGEEQKGVKNSGVYEQILRDQFTQAMRGLVNLVEADLAALYVNASRAYGTPGTAPFGTAADFSDFAGVLRILDDNGAPVSDRQLVLGSAAIANIRGKQSLLFKANESGTEDLLRRGIIGQVEGLDVHNSAAVKTHTKGTGASATTNNAGYAVGATVITLASAGTGTIVAGDVVTFAGDTNKYLVASGDADVSGGGTITLTAPGLRIAIAASTTAITVGNTGAQNMAFTRSAIQLITRGPEMPDGGDMASDVLDVTDPVSGLVFQVAHYKGYRRNKIEVGLAWGTKAVKSENIVALLG